MPFFCRNKDCHHKQAKSGISESILKSEDLLFEWCIISAEADDNIASAVLRRIVELYTTI